MHLHQHTTLMHTQPERLTHRHELPITPAPSWMKTFRSRGKHTDSPSTAANRARPATTCPRSGSTPQQLEAEHWVHAQIQRFEVLAHRQWQLWFCLSRVY